MTSALEQRVADLEEQIRGEHSEANLADRVREVARRLGREHGASDIVEQALREMGLDGSDSGYVKAKIEVVIRAKPSAQLDLDMDDDEDIQEVMEESLSEDLHQYGNYILDSDWTDVEIHSVEVSSAEAV